MANAISIEKIALSDEERAKLGACKDEAELKAAAMELIAAHYDLRLIQWGADLEAARHNPVGAGWSARVILMPKEAK